MAIDGLHSNNNNNHDDIYSAVIMTEVNCESSLSSSGECRSGRRHSDLGCESACFRQLLSTTTIAIYYYYSSRKLNIITQLSGNNE